MTFISREFDKYQVSYKSDKHGYADAQLLLYSQNELVGNIIFCKGGNPLRDNFYNEFNDIIVLFYRTKHFKAIHDILLHEKPLFIVINPDTLWGQIYSGNEEIIGELEPPD